MERKELLHVIDSFIAQVMPQKIILGILAGVALMGMVHFVAPYLRSSTPFDVDAIQWWHCICLGIVIFNRPK